MTAVNSAIVASMLAVAAMAATAGCDGDGGGRPSDGWRMLPQAPVGVGEGFQGLRGARIDGQALVVAGSTSQATTVAGIAFDLRARAWTRVPAAPLRWRAGFTLTAAGADALVWGGASNTGALADGARYDSVGGSWRRLAPSPLRGRSSHTSIWTGRRMVVWGGRSDDGPPLADGASYDPVRDRWRSLAAAPLRGRANHAAVWTGARMLVWGGDVTRPRRGGYVSDGAAYDPGTDRWSPIPAAPIRATEGVQAVWTGRRMLVVTDTEAASYDPAAGRWRRLPVAPLVFGGEQTAVWGAGELLVWGGVATTRSPACALPAAGVAYDPRRDAWRCIPASPLASRDRHRSRDRHAAVPLASGMLVWGGCCAKHGNWATDGAIYEPQPPPLRRSAVSGPGSTSR